MTDKISKEDRKKLFAEVKSRVQKIPTDRLRGTMYDLATRKLIKVPTKLSLGDRMLLLKTLRDNEDVISRGILNVNRWYENFYEVSAVDFLDSFYYPKYGWNDEHRLNEMLEESK